MEVSHIVKAPRERVYAAYTDFGAMPKWSKGVSAVRVVQSGGGTVNLESETGSGGRRHVSVAKLVLSAPSKVETERETRFTRILRTVKFDEAPEGTMVTASLDVRVKGIWAAVLTPRGKREAIESASQGLESFAKYVEGLQAPTIQ